MNTSEFFSNETLQAWNELMPSKLVVPVMSKNNANSSCRGHGIPVYS